MNILAVVPLMKLTAYGWGFIGIIIFSIVITGAILRRRNTKAGCFAFGYVLLVVFCISLLTFSLSGVLFSYVLSKTDTVINGKSYLARVSDYEERESVDDEGHTWTHYYPVVKFTTEDGRRVTRTLNESTLSGPPQIGSTQRVYYHDGKNTITTFGASTLIAFFGMLFMGLILGFCFVGIVMYAIGTKMERFWGVCSFFGFKILVPALMVAFDALLIYALFYGNTGPLWVKALLIFFIIVLTLAIAGYLKSGYGREMKLRRISSNRWEGDWE